MKTITEINPKTIKQIRVIIEQSLKDVMKDNNLRFELGNATYDEDSFKFTGFRIALADALTPEQKDLKRELDFRKQYSHLVTLNDSKTGFVRGVEYKLVGYKSRARKKPFIIEAVKDGQQYVSSESWVERVFGEDK